MPPLPATHAAGKKLEQLVDLVASSATFQASAGKVGDPVATRDTHIHWPSLLVDPSETNAELAQTAIEWPLAVIRGNGDFRFRKIGTGDADYFVPLGSLRLYLYDRDRVPASLGDSEITFFNFWGGVLADLIDANNFDTPITLADIQQIEGNQHSDLEAEPVAGHFWATGFKIQYGHNAF